MGMVKHNRITSIWLRNKYGELEEVESKSVAWSERSKQLNEFLDRMKRQRRPHWSRLK